MTSTAVRRPHVERVMGTVATVDVRDDAPRGDAVADVLAWLHHVDTTFSTYREDSVVRRLDRGELLVTDAPAEVREVLERCRALSRATHGAFDVRARGALDPSAYVKGWAVQRGADLLTAAGVEHFCLNAGGDLVARGHAAPGMPWRIGIQHPRDRAAFAATVLATDLAVATSGAYERGSHLVNPRTGAPPDGVLSVTVTGPDLGTADAYATAAFALGADGPAFTLGLEGYEALTILADDTVLTTPGFPAAA